LKTISHLTNILSSRCPTGKNTYGVWVSNPSVVTSQVLDNCQTGLRNASVR